MDLRSCWPGKKVRGHYTMWGWVDFQNGLCLRATQGATSVALELLLVGVAYAIDRTVLRGWSLYSPHHLPPGEIVAKFLKQALAKAAKAAKTTKTTGSAVSPAHPALSEFLTVETVDGQDRQTATMSIFWAQGTLRAFLNDRETQLSLCVTADSLTGILDALEASLVSDEPGWRPMGGKGPQKKGRGQK